MHQLNIQQEYRGDGLQRIPNESSRAARTQVRPVQRAFRIAVVDDEEGVRTTIKLILAGWKEARLDGLYSCARDALVGISQTRPHVVLMDIRLPDISGIECARFLKQQYPGILVVMISGLEDADTVDLAFQAGCDDYLTKPFSPSQCLVTLRRVLLNQDRFPLLPAETQPAPCCEIRARTGHCPRITDRGSNVLRCLSRGLFYKEVASELGLSLAQVRKQVHRILETYRVEKSNEAIRHWLKCATCTRSRPAGMR